MAVAVAAAAKGPISDAWFTAETPRWCGGGGGGRAVTEGVTTMDEPNAETSIAEVSLGRSRNSVSSPGLPRARRPRGELLAVVTVTRSRLHELALFWRTQVAQGIVLEHLILRRTHVVHARTVRWLLRIGIELDMIAAPVSIPAPASVRMHV